LVNHVNISSYVRHRIS